MNERTQRMNTHHVPAARSLRRARRDAVGVLQRHARGWMVRREGWWAAAIRAPGYRTQLLHGGHTGGVGAMAVLPDGMLVTGSGDNTVVL